MRAYTLEELFRLTRAELFALHRQIATRLAKLPEGSPRALDRARQSAAHPPGAGGANSHTEIAIATLRSVACEAFGRPVNNGTRSRCRSDCPDVAPLSSFLVKKIVLTECVRTVLRRLL